MQNVLSLILGGGRGTRLYPLTKLRSKPAVPIAGKYRLIDIPISNCINSGLNRIYVLTQFLSVSLHRHIANTYKFDPFSRGFVEVLAAQQTNEAADWYQGTADAVRQQIRYVHEDGCPRSADPLRRPALPHGLPPVAQDPPRPQADVTIAVLPVAREQAVGFRHRAPGRLGAGRRLRREAADRGAAGAARTLRRSGWQRRGIHQGTASYLASMGIYLFNREVADRLAQRAAAGHRLRQGDLSRAASARTACRPICSTATGRTWARSSRTTRPTWRWPATIRPSISTARRASSTRACASCRPRASAGPRWTSA